MRRVWLHDVGVFEMVPNSGHGSCLFQAISQALTFSTEFHYKIRTSTVEHMTSRKWAHKLNQFPDFWKHKIITQWLRKERAHFMRLKSQHCHHNRWRGRGRVTTVFACCRACRHFTEKFKERRRFSRYERIVGLHHKKRYDFHNKDLNSIFFNFMRRKNEPATKFELEAASNLFRFHFDYLQMIPIEMGFRQPDILNCNDENDREWKSNDESSNPSFDSLAQLLLQESISNGNCSSEEDENANKGNRTKLFKDKLLNPGSPNKSKDESKNVITVKMAMYQFYSCRNNNCELSRGSIFDQDHYYFLHSSMPNSCSSGNVPTGSLRDSKCYTSNHECGHWELLMPVFIKVDTIAKAIEAHIQQNPGLVPPEDLEWSHDEEDDYVGCAASLRDSFYVDVDEECYMDKKERNLNKIPARIPFSTGKISSIRRAVEKWKAYTNFEFLKHPPFQQRLSTSTDRETSDTDDGSEEGDHNGTESCKLNTSRSSTCTQSVALLSDCTDMDETMVKYVDNLDECLYHPSLNLETKYSCIYLWATTSHVSKLHFQSSPDHPRE
ncbi:unnamed protein product [Orchesella dallaii]|uniref:OTU domain-containing protein n=1 Tax=Orchesella dallaii TaxID=48710 RepID=A0ABP1RWY5_9HEXA